MEIDPPGYAVSRCCNQATALHVVRSDGKLLIAWVEGTNYVLRINNCLTCGMPIRIIEVNGHAQGLPLRSAP